MAPRLGSSNARAQRPFWLHQVAEYLIGAVVIAAGVQSPSPAVPAALGGLVLVNAAVVDGPVSAFDSVPRAVHRWIDVGLIIALAVAGVLPALDIDVGTRVLLVLVAGVLSSVWWFTSFEPSDRKRSRAARSGATRSGDRADDIGRAAGRAMGHGVNAWRRRRGSK